MNVEAWAVTVWAVGVIASFAYWFRISREIPAAERNDPFMICIMWPLVLLFLGGFMTWLCVHDVMYPKNPKL